MTGEGGRGDETEGVPWYLKGAGRGDGGGVNICFEIATEMSRVMEQRVSRSKERGIKGMWS
jgi:hypothetical protein